MFWCILLFAGGADPWTWTRIGLHEGPTLAVALDPAGDNVLAGGLDRKLTVWRLADRQRISHGCPHGQDVTAVAFGPVGEVVSAAGDFQIRRWKFADGSNQQVGNHPQRIAALASTADRKIVVSAGADGFVRRWALAGKTPEPLDLWKDRGVLHALAVDPAGKQLAAAGRERRVLRWDLAKNVALPELSGAQDSILALAFAPDAGHLLAGSADGRVRVWSVRGAGEELRKLEGFGEEVFALAAFGHAAVIAGDKGTALLWDWRSGTEIARRKLPAEALCMAAAPGQGRAVAGLADGSLWMVEVPDGSAAGSAR